MLCFSSLMQVDQTSIQPHTAVWSLKFPSYCFVDRKCRADNSLPFQWSVFVVYCVKSFQLADRWGLSFLSFTLSSRHPSHFLYQVPRHVSWYSQWTTSGINDKTVENFEFQKIKKKKKLLCAFPGQSADVGKVQYTVRTVLLPHMSIHAHHRNYSLLVKKACLSAHLHIVCLSTPSNKLPFILVPMSPRFCLF
jgi:hypothetical protein